MVDIAIDELIPAKVDVMTDDEEEGECLAARRARVVEKRIENKACSLSM